VIGRVLSTAFIVVVGVVVALIVVVPQLLGAVPLTVLTGSMSPTFRPGDIVVVQPTPVTDLVVGDVVTFQPVSGDPSLTTHRIVALRHDADGALVEVTTRGDANSADDLPIVPAQIQGRVRYTVPWVGYLTTTRNATMAGTTLLGLGLVGYSMFGIVKFIRARRTDRKISGAAPGVTS